MSLTKQEIDALVDELLKSTYGLCRYNVSDGTYTRAGVREAAYLAAGLTAEGQEKPKRVRCWLWSYLDGKPFHMAFSDPAGRFHMAFSDPAGRMEVGEDETLTPGWFVPDGEEG